MQQAVLGSWVGVGGLGCQRFQLPIDLRLCPVVDAPIEYAVATGFSFHDVVHFALVLKFFGVFPAQFCACLLFGKSKLHQFISVHPGHDTAFDLLPDGLFAEQKKHTAANERTAQNEQEGYGNAISQWGAVGLIGRENGDVPRSQPIDLQSYT